jgi:protein-S-isoprenylcysteine O-methyltransferase Ste14
MMHMRIPGTALAGETLATDRRLVLATRVLVSLSGAACAAYFAQASLAYYLATHRLIGGLFFVEQAWFVLAFLIRRPPRGSRPGDGASTGLTGTLAPWLLAAGGTFGGLLFRPSGAHPPWGVEAGLALQLIGLVTAIIALAALGRSFGFVAADRGLVTRGPYAVIRHPVYAAYFLIQAGYLLQSISLRNAVVLAGATACNIGRACAEERVLARVPGFERYRQRVRWRLVPGLW